MVSIEVRSMTEKHMFGELRAHFQKYGSRVDLQKALKSFGFLNLSFMGQRWQKTMTI
jgi:uncharacterized protein YqgQ